MPEATDRYPVDPLNGPAQFAEVIRDLERRISELEGAPPLTTKNLRVTGTGGGYDAFFVDGEGMDTPQFPLPQNFVPGAGLSYVSIPSGGGYLLVSRTILPILSHKAVRVFAGWGFSDGATTGNFRFLARQANPATPGSSDNPIHATTTAGTLGAGTAGTARLDWLHGLPLGEDGGNEFFYLDLEAQASGTGDIRCYEPSVTLMNDSHGATGAGAWTITAF